MINDAEDRVLGFAEKVVQHLPDDYGWTCERDGRVLHIKGEDVAFKAFPVTYPTTRIQWSPDWPRFTDLDGRICWASDWHGSGVDTQHDYGITTMPYSRYPERVAKDIMRRLVVPVEAVYPAAEEWARERAQEVQDHRDLRDRMVECAPRAWVHSDDKSRVTLDFGSTSFVAQAGRRSVFAGGTWGTDGAEVRIDRLSMPSRLAERVFTVMAEYAKEEQEHE